MNITETVLVVDDDRAHRTMLRTLLTGWGYMVEEADDGDTALDMVNDKPFDLILMDIRMMRMSGLEALKRIKSSNPAIPIIIMTAYSSVETAVEALKKGAYDYLTKPLDFEELRITMEQAMDHKRLKEENQLLKESLGKHFNRQNIIGASRSMEKLLETVAQIAFSDATVLINGESGTGKELIAGAIHFNSRRKDGPFVKINCAAITETLLESELFGHERGAFTGAERRKEGKFKQADNGTLFLDEVSEMSLRMQVKLLRVLQEREIVRVGGEQNIKFDVRLIAATNKDLEEEIQRGRFREDLYYRLNVVSLTVPPLRERKEDIPLLAMYFVKVFSKKNQKAVRGFTPQAMSLLNRYAWPGNIREIMNVIERGVVMARSEYLTEEDLALPDKDNDSLKSPNLPEALPLDEVEKATILKVLEITEGNKSEAARRLGITRKTLHKKLQKYNNDV